MRRSDPGECEMDLCYDHGGRWSGWWRLCIALEECLLSQLQFLHLQSWWCCVLWEEILFLFLFFRFSFLAGRSSWLLLTIHINTYLHYHTHISGLLMYFLSVTSTEYSSTEHSGYWGYENMMVVTPIPSISTVLTTYIYSLHSIYLPLSLYTEIQIQHSVPIDTEMSPPLVPRLFFLPSRASNCHFSPFFRRCKYQLQLQFHFYG